MTIKEAINLAHKCNLNTIEARSLLKYIFNKDDSYIIANIENNINKSEERQFIEYIDKIKNGYPLQYITNMQEFMGLKFYVNDKVLIPQPDTEILVLNAINYINHKVVNTKKKERIKVLDLCTGSGAIAISLKKFLNENVEIVASDISKEALEIAVKNSNYHNVNINFICSNMFEQINEHFDLIVSNPPYIKRKDIQKLPREVQKEPHIALDGGIDGLDYYRIIKKDVEGHLNDDGIVMMEIGYDQKCDIQKIFPNSTCIKDMENRDRVIIWNPFQVR